MKDNKRKVYVETSVISNLTARPSHNLVDAARQVSTVEWWSRCRGMFELFSSRLVRAEAMDGDADAAAKRMAALEGIPELPITAEMERLAEMLLARTAVPRTSFDDAVHIATATINGMDYLLTWNCKHIANAVTMPKIISVCREAGYVCPVICTPDQLQEVDDES